MSISDMIVVMKLGVVQQIGKPQEVYDNPANLFVANFLGTPPINIFTGHVKGERLFIGVDNVMDVPGVKDQDVFVGIRPEGFILDMANGTLCCKLHHRRGQQGGCFRRCRALPHQAAQALPVHAG